MNLTIDSWKPFLVSDIFDIFNGSGITKEEIECNPGDFAAIQSGEENNGCIGKIDKNYCVSMNYTYTEEPCLTVARTGSAGYVAFQPSGCVVGDSAKILLLKNNEAKSTLVYLFLKTILMANQYKYTYGRKVTESKYMAEIIMLPATPEGKPDWDYMESFIKSLNHKPLATTNQGRCASPTLGVESWKEFVYTDIFNLRGGFYNKKPEHSVEGNIPFLASTDSNNGVTEYYCIEDIKQWDKVGGEDWTLDQKLYAGNCIAVTVNGSVCNAYYQADTFTCSHDITALYLKKYELNRYIAIFLCTVIMKEKFRWSYGRKPHDVKKFGKSFIKLPVNKEGTPDWHYMENYIKALPYGDKI